MKIKDYSIIETECINEEIIYQEKRLEAIKKEIDKDWKGKYNYENSLEIENAKAKLNILKAIKSKIKPLIPIVEHSFDKGRDYQRDFGVINSKENYINNTEI